jgi:hypothetical protein
MTTYALPAAIPTVRVHGTYVGPDGSPLAGSVTFSGPGLLTFAGSDLFVAGPVVAKLDANGHFEVILPATDYADMNPNGWSWTVKENLTGVTGSRTYPLLLTSGMGEIDLADVAPTDPAPPVYTPVPGLSAYEVAVSDGFVGTEVQWLASLKGDPGVVTTVNGKTGSSVTLAASDVGAMPATNTGIAVTGAAGGYRSFNLQTAGVNRWQIQVDDGAETGSGTGSNFRLSARDDAGAFKYTVLYADRATGALAVNTTLPVTSSKLSVAGAFALKNVGAPAVDANSVQLYSNAGTAWAVRSDGKTVALGTGIAAASTSSGAYVGQYRDGAIPGTLERWDGSAWQVYDTGWVALPMPTGYVWFSTNAPALSIRRTGTFVQLRGRITRSAGNIPAAETLTALIPVGFRPAGPSGGYVESQCSTSAVAPAYTGTVRAEIRTTGDFIIGSGVALGSNWIGFGGGTNWTTD